jgi:hypothetical protein
VSDDSGTGVGFGGVSTDLSGYAVHVSGPAWGFPEVVMGVLLLALIIGGVAAFITLHLAPLLVIAHQHRTHRRNTHAS